MEMGSEGVLVEEERGSGVVSGSCSGGGGCEEVCW